MKNTFPSHLSDDDLASAVMRIARSARDATAQLVAHLAEFDERRLYLGAGFPSLFAYCFEALRLSEHEALNRIEAARAARRFPVILDMLCEGSMTLSTVRLLAPQLTPGNHEELLKAASRKTKREVLELLVRLVPRPLVASSIRKVPARREAAAPSTPAPATGTVSAAPEPVASPFVAGPAVAPPPPLRRPLATPLAPDRYELRCTVSASTLEKLRLAQDLLRHAVPTGDPAEVVDRALTALLEQLARRKFAATDRPRAGGEARSDTRHTPASVKRAVSLRDEGRCAFIGKDGRRCNARGFLEFHHVKPFAMDGLATVDNIQLRCRAHNAYEADLYFSTMRPEDGGGLFRETCVSYGDLMEHSTRSGTS